MNMIHLTPADYLTTRWSGGATTQLAIAPEGAVYAERDFLWRLSSATVELDESDFTPLPDYHRIISTLRGDMVLSHNGGAELTLHPYDVYEFEGGDDTRSRGRCRDFNLMLRKDVCGGAVRALRVGAGALSFRAENHENNALLLYCAEGRTAVRCGGETLSVGEGESVLLREAKGALVTIEAAAPAVLMSAQAWRL